MAEKKTPNFKTKPHFDVEIKLTGANEFAYDVTPVNKQNFMDVLSTLMNGYYSVATELLLTVPTLREVTKEEMDLGVYVYETNDYTDEEHKLFQTRKALYHTIKDIQDALVSEMFPDVEYIENCGRVHQEIAIENKEDPKEYQKKVEECVNYVRGHYEEILAANKERVEAELAKREAKEQVGDVLDKDS